MNDRHGQSYAGESRSCGFKGLPSSNVQSLCLGSTNLKRNDAFTRSTKCTNGTTPRGVVPLVHNVTSVFHFTSQQPWTQRDHIVSSLSSQRQRAVPVICGVMTIPVPGLAGIIT